MQQTTNAAEAKPECGNCSKPATDMCGTEHLCLDCKPLYAPAFRYRAEGAYEALAAALDVALVNGHADDVRSLVEYKLSESGRGEPYEVFTRWMETRDNAKAEPGTLGEVQHWMDAERQAAA